MLLLALLGPIFFCTMTDVGTHALLKKWADAVALCTGHRGVYSPESTRTVSWASLENCAWSTLDTPVALVKLTQRVDSDPQPHNLTDPLLSLFDNNPNLQAIVLQLHDTDARAVAEHVKKSRGGPNRGMSLYLREWEMPDGTLGIHVSGDVAAGCRKWECKAHQVQRGHWEDTAPLYSLHSQSPWSWHADLEGHTPPTWYKGTGMHPSLFFPLTTAPLFGVEHHHVSISVEVVDHRHVDELKDLPQWGHAFQSGFISVDWMEKLQDEYGELRGDAGVNILNEDWPAETRAGDSDTLLMAIPPEGGAMYSFARAVLIPHLEPHLGWKRPVVNVTTCIVVKAGTVDVGKNKCGHRDINLSYVTGPDQHHVICLFPMFSPTPDDGCAGDWWLHHTRASRTLGLWPHWSHWTLGMCCWAIHLLCIEEVFALPLTPIGRLFSVSFQLVPQGSTTTTLAPLLFPLGPAKRPHPPMGLKPLMPLVVQSVVR